MDTDEVLLMMNFPDKEPLEVLISPNNAKRLLASLTRMFDDREWSAVGEDSYTIAEPSKVGDFMNALRRSVETEWAVDNRRKPACAITAPQSKLAFQCTSKEGG